MGIRRQGACFARWRLRLTGPTNSTQEGEGPQAMQLRGRCKRSAARQMNIRRDAMVPLQKSIFTVNCTSRGSPIWLPRLLVPIEEV